MNEGLDRRRHGAHARRATDGAWLPRWCGPLSIATAFVLLAWWSWGKWSDPTIDFGIDPYVAWQLSTGKSLYLDIAYRNGPLSQYVNALWFLLFGVSLRTLVFCNLTILVGICALTYLIFQRACGRFTATVACLVLLSVFSFSQYVGIANYNYVTPYQHYQTHGLALSIAMVAAFSQFLRGRRRRWCALAGGCLGLLFLTKAELFVPAVATAGLGLLLSAASEPAGGRARARLVLCFVGAALLPVAGSLATLSAQMPAELALRGVLGNWAHVGAGMPSDRFYVRGAGLDDVPGNLRTALRAFLAITAFAASALAADRLLPARRWRAAWSATAGVVLFAVLVSAPRLVPWFELARALPFTSLAVCLGLGALALRVRPEPEMLARWAPLALWAVYALALLGKMILNARFGHYGFALAMPATLLLVVCLVQLGPTLLRDRVGRGGLARALGVAAVGAGVVFCLRWSNNLYERKDLVIGEPGDSIVVEGPRFSPRGVAMKRAVRELRDIMPPDATLLVIPQGNILNYWLRSTNPTRYLLLVPPEVAAFGGEAAILEDFRAHAPDFIVLLHRPFAEFGVGPFGRDPRNGLEIMRWVNQHYERVRRIGAEPFRDRRFGIDILRRNESANRRTAPL